MDTEASRLALLADDDSDRANERARACESSGMNTMVATLDASAVDLAATGSPGAIVISLATDAGLSLLHALSRDPRTRTISVVVVDCASDHARVRAEQCGTVAMFLDDHAPATLASAVGALLNLDSDSQFPEFPARCPRCEAQHGLPRSVSTAALTGTYVGLECGGCGQSWRVLRPGAPPATPSS